VLDFGLAKSGDSQTPDLTHSPTLTVDVTRGGVLLGTAAYMSPEQARGQEVDKRTDIWAFGCVLYEMLAGKPAFRGDTVTDVLVAILERELDWSALPGATPASVRRLLAQCFERDRKKRRRDIGDVLLDLDAPPPLDAPAAPAARVFGYRGVLAGGATVAAIVVGLLAAGILRAPSSTPSAPDEPPSISRATWDEGFTADPAISRDGALVAYASDRGGDNQLDIWIQQTTGSSPIRVTHDSFDEREPSFSPDGSRIVFRSERDGGGVYIVPAFGSEAPRLLVAGGRRPRFSPDGQLIVYWTGSNIGFATRAGRYRTYVVPAAGGTPRDIAPQLTAVRFPAWSPDGTAVLALASQAAVPTADTYDWWVIPVDGRAPIQTGAYNAIGDTSTPETAGLNSTAGGLGPDDWNGSRVLFSNLQFLFSITIDPRTYRVEGPPRRLTFGTNHDAQAASAASGAVVFSSASILNTVFGLSLDQTGTASAGAPTRLTEGSAYDSRPSASSDGRLIAYRSTTTQMTAVVKDLAANRLTDLGARLSNFGPAISPDGKSVAFETGDGVDVVPSQGGPSRTLCRPCQIGDWTEDSAALAVVMRDRLVLVDVASTTPKDLVVGEAVSRPFPSPDRRLLAFRAQDNGMDRVYVARVDTQGPVSREHWSPLGSAEVDGRPAGWSRDGTLVYVVSSRDGTRCLYAVRIDRETGQPQGEAFAVRHFHGSRNAWAGTTGVLSTGPASAVRGGRFLYDLATFSANVWLMTPTARPEN